MAVTNNYNPSLPALGGLGKSCLLPTLQVDLSSRRCLEILKELGFGGRRVGLREACEGVGRRQALGGAGRNEVETADVVLTPGLAGHKILDGFSQLSNLLQQGCLLPLKLTLSIPLLLKGFKMSHSFPKLSFLLCRLHLQLLLLNFGFPQSFRILLKLFLQFLYFFLAVG